MPARTPFGRSWCWSRASGRRHRGRGRAGGTGPPFRRKTLGGLSREAAAAHGGPPGPRRRAAELSAPRGGPRPVGARRPVSRAELPHERWPSEGRPRRMMSWGPTRRAAGPHQITHLAHASWPLVSEVRTNHHSRLAATAEAGGANPSGGLMPGAHPRPELSGPDTGGTHGGTPLLLAGSW